MRSANNVTTTAAKSVQHWSRGGFKCQIMSSYEATLSTYGSGYRRSDLKTHRLGVSEHFRKSAIPKLSRAYLLPTIAAQWLRSGSDSRAFLVLSRGTKKVQCLPGKSRSVVVSNILVEFFLRIR